MIEIDAGRLRATATGRPVFKRRHSRTFDFADLDTRLCRRQNPANSVQFVHVLVFYHNLTGSIAALLLDRDLHFYAC